MIKALSQAVKKAFRTGETSFIVDPSELTTLYQNSTGTTPVTAFDQPVGLVINNVVKDGLGRNLVSNSNSESGAITFPSDALTRFVSKSQSTDFAQSGTYSTKLTADSTSGTHYWTVASVPANTAVILTGWAYIPSGATNSQPIRVVDVSDGSSVVDVVAASPANTWVFFSYMRPGKATQWNLSLGHNGASNWNGGSIYFDNINFAYLSNNQFYQATSTARPLLKQANNLNYLKFDGVDDCLKTAANLDLSKSPYLTLFAVVEADSLSAQAVLFESDGAVGNGDCILRLPPGTTENCPSLSINSTSSSRADSSATIIGTKLILAATYTINRSAGLDMLRLRVNGLDKSLSLVSHNAVVASVLSNAVAYIGSRVGTSQFFNGKLFFLAGINKLVNINEIKAIENALSKQFGVGI